MSLRDLWSLIRGEAVIVSKAFVDEHAYRQTLLNNQTATLAQWGERIAEFEKQAASRFENRSAASRKAHETRKANAANKEQT